MGTKNDPGNYDCHAKAAPNEPIFTLRANDPLAPLAVHSWANAAALAGVDPVKVEEARRCADAMDAWRAAKLKADGTEDDSRASRFAAEALEVIRRAVARGDDVSTVAAELGRCFDPFGATRDIRAKFERFAVAISEHAVAACRAALRGDIAAARDVSALGGGDLISDDYVFQRRGGPSGNGVLPREEAQHGAEAPTGGTR